MPDCEAARRNKQALFELELSWGNGIVDLGKLQRILKGSDGTEASLSDCAPDSH